MVIRTRGHAFAPPTLIVCSDREGKHDWGLPGFEGLEALAAGLKQMQLGCPNSPPYVQPKKSLVGSEDIWTRLHHFGLRLNLSVL